MFDDILFGSLFFLFFFLFGSILFLGHGQIFFIVVDSIVASDIKHQFL